MRRYDPAGKPERTLLLPVKIPTCIGLGGEDLRGRYITSAWYSLLNSIVLF